MGKVVRAYKKMADGGDLPGDKLSALSPVSKFINPLGSQATPGYFRPAFVLPQSNKLKIKDTRKVNAISGEPIIPSNNLTGDYNTDRIDNIVHYAKMYGQNPYNLLAVDMQETQLGKDKIDRHKGTLTDPGHLTIETPMVNSKANLQGLPDSVYEARQPYDDFSRAYQAKILEAKKRGLTGEAQQLQAYNGYGKIFPSTEQNYSGKLTKAYGVPVPVNGLDMKKNPLYGKRIIDLRDNVLKQNPGIRDAVNTTFENGGNIMKKPADRKGFFAAKMRRMDDGGPTPNAWQSANQWATNNQTGISGAAGFGAATVDAFAPTDKYGVRSNGAALGSGALKGAASGAAIGSMIGPEGTLIGAGVGAVVGGVSGLVGNEKANKAKINAIQGQTTAQLTSMQAYANARIAGDPSLKYGNRDASYYRFGGVMKGSPPTGPRLSKPIPAVQPAQRLMPPITDSPNRQVNRKAYGGEMGGLPKATRAVASKLYKPIKSYKSQVAQMAHGGRMPAGLHKPHKSVAQPRVQGQSPIPSAQPPVAPAQQGPPPMPQGMHPQQMAQMQQMMSHGNGLRQQANGGQIQPLSSQDAKFNGPSHANGGIKLPHQGVEVEGGETANKGFVFSKKLGYAQKHEQIAKQMGKAEKRPESPLNKATTGALQRKTELLKQQQEAHKASMGMPNDLGKMANGGPIDPPVKKAPAAMIASDTTGFPAPGSPYWKQHPIVTEHKDGTVRPWGENLPTVPAGTTPFSNSGQGVINPPKGLPAPIVPSDKAAGSSSGCYPSRNQQQGKDVFTQYSSRFKFGGKMKKMDDGGDLYETDPPTKKKPSPFDFTKSAEDWIGSKIGALGNTYLTNVKKNTFGIQPTAPAPVTTATAPAALGSPKSKPQIVTPSVTVTKPRTRPVVGSNPAAASPVAPTTAAPVMQPVAPGSNMYPLIKPGKDTTDLTALNVPDSKVAAPDTLQMPTNIKDTTDAPAKKGAKFSAAVDKLTPFLSNFMNATQRLPLPPTPTLNTEITPNLVNYDASRAEAVRQTRGADKTARENLNSGAAVSATKAANLAAQDRSIGQANEAESNTNAGIRNQAAAENAQIKAGNTALINNYQNEMVGRQLKSQQLQSQNVANIEEKLSGMRRDKSLNDLEGQKAMLGWLQNNTTGAGWEAVRPIVSKYVNADGLKTLDDQMSQRRQSEKEDREYNRSQGAFGAYMKGRGLDPTKFKGDDYNSQYQAWLLGPGSRFRQGAETEKTDAKGNTTTTVKIK